MATQICRLRLPGGSSSRLLSGGFDVVDRFEAADEHAGYCARGCLDARDSDRRLIYESARSRVAKPGVKIGCYLHFRQFIPFNGASYRAADELRNESTLG